MKVDGFLPTPFDVSVPVCHELSPSLDSAVCPCCQQSTQRASFQSHVSQCFLLKHQEAKRQSEIKGTNEFAPSDPTATISSIRDQLAKLDLHRRIHLMEAFTRLANSTNQSRSSLRASSPSMVPASDEEEALSLVFSPSSAKRRHTVSPQPLDLPARFSSDVTMPMPMQSLMQPDIPFATPKASMFPLLDPLKDVSHPSLFAASPSARTFIPNSVSADSLSNYLDVDSEAESLGLSEREFKRISIDEEFERQSYDFPLQFDSAANPSYSAYFSQQDMSCRRAAMMDYPSKRKLPEPYLISIDTPMRRIRTN